MPSENTLKSANSREGSLKDKAHIPPQRPKMLHPWPVIQRMIMRNRLDMTSKRLHIWGSHQPPGRGCSEQYNPGLTSSSCVRYATCFVGRGRRKKKKSLIVSPAGWFVIISSSNCPYEYSSRSDTAEPFPLRLWVGSNRLYREFAMRFPRWAARDPPRPRRGSLLLRWRRFI